MRDGSRKIVEVAELTGIREGRIEINSLFKYGDPELRGELVNREKMEMANLSIS